MNLENRIQISEIDDRITIVIKYNSVWENIILILIGFFFLFWSYLDYRFGVKIFTLAAGGYMFLWGTYELLVRYSVTIDKKSEKIIKKVDSNFNFLKSIEEISFSDLNRIEIKEIDPSLVPGVYIEGTKYSWRVNLVKIQGDSIKIYETIYKSDAEVLAEKIGKITNSEIIRK